MEKERKTATIQEFARHGTDTGSPEVQVAILTRRIGELTDHLKAHRKDKHTRYGLIKMVGQRQRLLRYLAREDPERYVALLERLGLKR